MFWHRVQRGRLKPYTARYFSDAELHRAGAHLGSHPAQRPKEHGRQWQQNQEASHAYDYLAFQG
jgi:hypothetical protein